jgi:cytochrome c oxidase subunit 1
VLAAGLPLIGYGLIFNLVLSGIGGAVVIAGFVGWALEPPDDEDLPPHGHDDHGGGGDAEGETTPDDAPAAELEEATVDG